MCYPATRQGGKERDDNHKLAELRERDGRHGEPDTKDRYAGTDAHVKVWSFCALIGHLFGNSRRQCAGCGQPPSTMHL